MFFGSDIIILGLSSLRYDKNVFLLCIVINVVFLDFCNKLIYFNVFFFFSKMIFEICLSEYEYMSGK